MADPGDVAVEVQEHLTRWNSEPTDGTISNLVGHPAPEGDTRSTANPQGGGDSLANADSDGPLPSVPTDDEGNPQYDDDSLTNKDLKRLLAARGLPQSGNKDELVERLQESDSDES